MADTKLPRTPPYTPNPLRNRFARSESPASIKSLHPLETTSPSKKPEAKTTTSNEDDNDNDDVKVEELHEGDAGYASSSNAEMIYPDELEEPESPDEDLLQSESDSDNNTLSDKDESGNEITRHFSRLGCNDGQDAARFARRWRAKHARRRTESRVFKRTYSQIVRSEGEMGEGNVATGEQDAGARARRLRRRLRGPTPGPATGAGEARGRFGEGIWAATPPPSRGVEVAGEAKMTFDEVVYESGKVDGGTNDDVHADDMDVDED